MRQARNVDEQTEHLSYTYVYTVGTTLYPLWENVNIGST